MKNRQPIVDQYWLRAVFLAIKVRQANFLLEQGLYPEHDELQKEIQKDIENNNLLLTFVESRVSNKNPHIWS